MISFLDRILSGKKALICDFDGVLVRLNTDYSSLRAELHNFFRKKYSFLNQFHPLHEKLYIIEEKYGRKAYDEARGIILKFEKRGLENALPNHELIEYIRKSPRRIRKAIFSSNLTETIESFLVENNLKELFELVISRDSVRRTKPQPEGLKMILERFDISTGEAVFIGDRDVDLEAGRLAGVQTFIVFNWSSS